MTAAVAALKARGFNSPYLRNFVVARINPLRFIKGEPPPIDELLPSMTKRRAGMDVGKIKNEDVARTGGAPEAARGVTVQHATPRAVIFDLDGTLTEPVLDFDAMRAEIGLPRGLPILEQLEQLDAGERARAEAIMLRHERAAIAQATLADGCADLLGHLRGDGDPDGDPDPQRPRGRRHVRAHVRVPVPRRLHARGRPAQAVAARRAVALPGDGRRARGHARRRRLQVRRAGRAATPAAGPCWSAASRSPTHELADWGSPDLVVKSLRELLPLFGR